jgi:hypothetical protein
VPQRHFFEEVEGRGERLGMNAPCRAVLASWKTMGLASSVFSLVKRKYQSHPSVVLSFKLESEFPFFWAAVSYSLVLYTGRDARF